LSASPVVAMFGLSGVGKGWMARSVCIRHPEILHLEASALMRAAMNTTGEALRTATAATVKDNQLRLVAAFDEARRSSPDRPVLFDGHSVIDNDHGLVEIPVAAIADLSPTAIVFVQDHPVLIRQRRLADERRRPDRSEEELAGHQGQAREVAAGYARYLAIPFQVVEAGDWQALTVVLGCTVR
jgi:adenylate kinase